VDPRTKKRTRLGKPKQLPGRSIIRQSNQGYHPNEINFGRRSINEEETNVERNVTIQLNACSRKER
jgi:hypothetical protein